MQETGLWEAMNRISNIYLLFLTTSLITYYLPRISEIDSDKELRKEVWVVSKLTIPAVVVVILLLYLLRNFVIELLLTKEFSDVTILFPYQLMGDFFKSVSWLLAFILIAKGKTTINIILNLLTYSSYFFLTTFLIDYSGFIGVSQSYFVTYFVYFMVVVFIFRNLIFQKN